MVFAFFLRDMSSICHGTFKNCQQCVVLRLKQRISLGTATCFYGACLGNGGFGKEAIPNWVSNKHN